MAKFRTLDDIGEVRGKVALVRVDLNLPMADGRVTDLTRALTALTRTGGDDLPDHVAVGLASWG